MNLSGIEQLILLLIVLDFITTFYGVVYTRRCIEQNVFLSFLNEKEFTPRSLIYFIIFGVVTFFCYIGIIRSTGDFGIGLSYGIIALYCIVLISNVFQILL